MGGCGGDVENKGTIYSPGFPGYYPKNLPCTWTIATVVGRILRLQFVIHDIREGDTLVLTEFQDGINREIEVINSIAYSCSNEVQLKLDSHGGTNLDIGTNLDKGIFAVTFQGDGYIGCYDCHRKEHFPWFESLQMTIQLCLEHCHTVNQGIQFAGLYGGNECHCFPNISHCTEESDELCTERCSGDDTHVCGGLPSYSIYEKLTYDCYPPFDDSDQNFSYDGTCPYFDGDVISVTCDEGYVLASHHSSIVCHRYLGWNDSLPECAVIDCGDPGDVKDADRQGEVQEFTYNSTMKYVCHEGFYMDGNDIIICTENGNWTSKPVCIQHGSASPNSGSIGVGGIVGTTITVVILILVAAFFAVSMYRRSMSKEFATADATFSLERTPRARDEDQDPVRYESTPVRYADLVSRQGHRHIDGDTGEMINYDNGSVEQHGMVDNIAYESAGQDRYDNEYTVIDHVKVNNCKGTVDNIAYEPAVNK